MHDALLDQLLSDSRAVVLRLLDEPPTTADALRHEVDALDDVLSAAGDESFADLILARQLVSGCHALLAAWPKAEPRHRHLIQVAVRYVVLDDDGDEDLSSPFGFDDDVEVFNAVAQLLDRRELLIR